MPLNSLPFSLYPHPYPLSPLFSYSSGLFSRLLTPQPRTTSLKSDGSTLFAVTTGVGGHGRGQTRSFPARRAGDDSKKKQTGNSQTSPDDLELLAISDVAVLGDKRPGVGAGGPCDEPHREKLPEQREKAGPGTEAVVGIAREVAAEHLFFVEEAEDDQRDDSEEAWKRPPGAKRKRREEQHENTAEVHGMADEPIGSRGDDFLPFFDLDGARGETILFHDPKRNQIAGGDEDLGKYRQPKRDARPAEAVIQPGNQQGPKENQLGPFNDGFLLADLFIC